MVTGGPASGDGLGAMIVVWRGIVVTVRVVAAITFCFSGWIKLQSPQAFADSIATFQLLPAPLISLLALGLPPFELAVGGLLLTGWKPRAAAFCGLAACTVFLLALGSALVRGLPVECGCFGGVPSSLSPTHRLWLAIGRDLLLLGALLVVYVDAHRRRL